MSSATTSPAKTLFGMPMLGVTVAASAVVIDQATKYVVVEHILRPDGIVGTPYLTDKLVPLIPFFQLRMAWNPGISFSMFNSGEALTVAILLMVQIAITLVLIWWLRSLEGRWLQVACGLVIGGALGNIIDRAMFGAVADFLDFYVGDWHFPTFNVADSCISVGAVMWLLDAVLARPHDAPK
jgi:signal peptidase II